VSNKSGFRQERLATPSASHAPAEEKKPAPAPADPAARPAPGPDTVVLKDGTTVNGKIVGRSDEAILLKTPEGKMVKIEADKVAEIRSQPKK
jgi:hypothetical protein